MRRPPARCLFKAFSNHREAAGRQAARTYRRALQASRFRGFAILAALRCESPESYGSSGKSLKSFMLGSRYRFVTRTPLGQSETMHTKQKLDAEQNKGQRHRREQPPFRDDQRLDRQRAALEACYRDARSIPDEVKAANHADNVADPFEQPADLGW